MVKVLWLSPFSLHDLANNVARQVYNMLQTLAQRNIQVVVLNATIYTNANPYSIKDKLRHFIFKEGGSETNFTENDITFFYLRTQSHLLKDLKASEQRHFYNYSCGLVQSFKPDLVMTSCSDVLSSACINQAKRCGIPSAFILNEAPARYYRFADIDIILSTCNTLTTEHVTPLKLEAINIGPFIPVTGPLIQKISSEQKSALKERLLQNKTILLVAPNLNHGLGIFLKLSEYARSEKVLKNYKFVVLETEHNQYLTCLNSYHEKGNGQKAFHNADFTHVEVLDNKHELTELLEQTRVLCLPALSYVCAPFIGLQAISYGVPVITTPQPTLQEYLQEAAQYVDIKQELLDNFTLAPTDEDVEPWVEALKAMLKRKDSIECCSKSLEQYHYESGSKRLAMALEPFLKERAGTNPQLLRDGSFSVRAAQLARAEQLASEQEAKRRELEAEAEAISEQESDYDEVHL